MLHILEQDPLRKEPRGFRPRCHLTGGGESQSVWCRLEDGRMPVTRTLMLPRRSMPMASCNCALKHLLKRGRKHPSGACRCHADADIEVQPASTGVHADTRFAFDPQSGAGVFLIQLRPRPPERFRRIPCHSKTHGWWTVACAPGSSARTRNRSRAATTGSRCADFAHRVSIARRGIEIDPRNLPCGRAVVSSSFDHDSGVSGFADSDSVFAWSDGCFPAQYPACLRPFAWTPFPRAQCRRQPC